MDLEKLGLWSFGALEMAHLVVKSVMLYVLIFA